MSGRQRRPEGAARQVTSLWKQLVRDALAAHELTQSDLATAIGATPGGVSTMLSPETQTSKLVDDVCRYLGLPPPVVLIESEEQWQWIDDGRLLAKLRPKAYEAIAERVSELADSARDADEDDLLTRIATLALRDRHGERIILQRDGQSLAAVISLHDLELFDKLMERLSDERD